MFGFFKKKEPPKQQGILSRNEMMRIFVESYPKSIPAFIVVNDWEGFENILVEATPDLVDEHWRAFNQAMGRFLMQKSL